MTRLPTLGPRGEGWVLAQGVLFVLVVAAGAGVPGAAPAVVGPLPAAAGLVVFAAGAILAASASAWLQRGRAFTALPRPRAGGELVSSGPYRLVRHPIYGGIVLMAAGWSIARWSIAAAVPAVALLAFFDLKRRREEAWLEARFPGYPAYRAGTRRLIPWIY